MEGATVPARRAFVIFDTPTLLVSLSGDFESIPLVPHHAVLYASLWASQAQSVLIVDSVHGALIGL
ncbi:hypothetical protein XNC1_3968 [Xenorhabdus nematophila ATCC 19061]|uniref:Uncharacterized protein n=1 Tax=Xenorhabdus nematophila (strain ATCC 19061 / DSM 3370 / CCUG 14189 / LMG 1036 / NCIMB 9965 / AN6) TaxID=406817 RepID=D3VCG1_XENNA|nr:hypothetical protein XNC1_3968 [Xenorhabdus nematophila ATCC 19061]CEE92699.1 hypothetical protein XNA1_3030005 [Xenorhabdus nematophila str. Anatoliense]CEF32594.1 hypothetical protein XNW1_4410005 [Xenorhabdus nematophila str. Websteri]CEK24813.1 hypothetical protein XNC2_3822 [Xenorhabdus nematophila AN6/1]